MEKKQQNIRPREIHFTIENLQNFPEIHKSLSGKKYITFSPDIPV